MLLQMGIGAVTRMKPAAFRVGVKPKIRTSSLQRVRKKPCFHLEERRKQASCNS